MRIGAWLMLGLLLSTTALAQEPGGDADAPLIEYMPGASTPPKPQLVIKAPAPLPDDNRPALILQYVNLLNNVKDRSGNPADVVPYVYFLAPNEKAVTGHSALIAGGGPQRQTAKAVAFAVPAEARKAGIVILDGWTCGPEQYAATFHAYLSDADGNQSNTNDYTIHCNGG